MIDLKPLFAYQEAEKKLASAEAALRNTPSRIKLNQLYRLLKNQQQLVSKLNDELHEREQQFLRIKEQVEKLADSLDLEKSELETMQKDEESTSEEMAELRGDLDTLQRDMNSCLREIRKSQQQIEKSLEDYQSARSVYAKAKKEYDALKAVCEKEKEDFSSESESLTKEIESLARSVDPVLMERYNRAKLHNASQPMAKVINSRCSGCNMSLPTSVIKKLEADNVIVECENCGRILYKED